MKTMTVGELKAQFSEVLAQMAKGGEPIAISYGRKKLTVAAIVPIAHLKPKRDRVLGLMQGHARCIVHDDFSISDEQMLES